MALENKKVSKSTCFSYFLVLVALTQSFAAIAGHVDEFPANSSDRAEAPVQGESTSRFPCDVKTLKNKKIVIVLEKHVRQLKKHTSAIDIAIDILFSDQRRFEHQKALDGKSHLVLEGTLFGDSESLKRYFEKPELVGKNSKNFHGLEGEFTDGLRYLVTEYQYFVSSLEKESDPQLLYQMLNNEGNFGFFAKENKMAGEVWSSVVRSDAEFGLETIPTAVSDLMAAVGEVETSDAFNSMRPLLLPLLHHIEEGKPLDPKKKEEIVAHLKKVPRVLQKWIDAYVTLALSKEKREQHQTPENLRELIDSLYKTKGSSDDPVVIDVMTQIQLVWPNKAMAYNIAKVRCQTKDSDAPVRVLVGGGHGGRLAKGLKDLDENIEVEIDDKRFRLSKVLEEDRRKLNYYLNIERIVQEEKEREAKEGEAKEGEAKDKK